MALETAGAPERRLHHITRIDIEPSGDHPRRHPTHGWQVRHRRDGQRLSKFFADALMMDMRPITIPAAICTS